MTSEIRLIQEIEKYQCLYNTSLPEYNRKEPSDAAWAKISDSTELTVTECKEKWRNIRCSLLRSLKPSEKAKKPYYLASYLQFVVPFMKTINQEDVQNVSINNYREREARDTDFILSNIKTEAVEVEENEIVVDPINTGLSDTESHFVPFVDPVQRNRSVLKRKRNNLAFNRKFKRMKQKKIDEQTYDDVINAPNSSSESMKYFLMSLLPEFETMTEDQCRLFKIKVMMLIDDIKTDYLLLKQNMPSSSESNRLQKRLINLLLTNLKK